MTASALAGLAVLEIPGPMTAYAGKLLADMGADVTLVEPPGGCAARQEEAFPDMEWRFGDSLTFKYLNTNKRSLTLDLTSATGQQTGRELAGRAAVLLEDRAPGAMAALGLGYEALAGQNPALAYVSISPFGQDGPYASFAASDLTLLALGGLLYLGGYSDGAPMRAAGNQALLAAGQFAAVAALIAVLEAEATGHGQHVDVSAQQCVVAALETSAQYWDLEKVIRTRTSGVRTDPGSGIMPCADGHIYMTARFGPTTAYWHRLVDWLIEDGAPGAEALRDDRWTDPVFLKTEEARKRFADICLPFSMSRTRAQLYQAASRRQLPFSPINTPAEVVASEHLRARGYFVPAPDLPAGGGPALIAGPPYHLTATPWQLRHGAPGAGEHTAEVLANLSTPVVAGFQPAREVVGGAARPLEGIRVADFTWHGAGSFTTRLLADHGAEVIK
ncbi:MAG: CoA transferase, partial [Chloroflexota bacterium]|nr:CoA transferase [Chloroflexota bacterium]